jgi:hypothetical protein
VRRVGTHMPRSQADDEDDDSWTHDFSAAL